MSRNYLEVVEVFVNGLGWKKKAETIDELGRTTILNVSYIELDSNGNIHGHGYEDIPAEKFSTIATNDFIEIRIYGETDINIPKKVLETIKINFVGGNREDMEKYLLKRLNKDVENVEFIYY